MLTLFNMILEIPKDKKIIICSTYVKTSALIALFAKRRKITYLTLSGKHSFEERSCIVNKFQETNSNIKILIISLKAGGVGLTLTAATEQASNWVYRIGQTITCYCLLSFHKENF